MLGKIFFHLLILCGIWYQEITGTFADKEIRESSNILVRQKRVINRMPGEDVTVLKKTVPYIVIIKNNNRIACAGTILSRHVVITINTCVLYHKSLYSLLSSSSRPDYGNPHNVTNIKRHYVSPPNNVTHSIALLTVYPPFIFGLNSNRIELHSGPLLPGTLAIISGWGYNVGSSNPGTNHSRNLRTIEVPIISHRDCVNTYGPLNIEILEFDICTHHPQKYCGHTDGGAPLVVGNYLAGIHLFSGLDSFEYCPKYPDVFALLQHSEYRQWINSNIISIEAAFQNRH